MEFHGTRSLNIYTLVKNLVDFLNYSPSLSLSLPQNDGHSLIVERDREIAR